MVRFNSTECTLFAANVSRVKFDNQQKVRQAATPIARELTCPTANGQTDI